MKHVVVKTKYFLEGLQYSGKSDVCDEGLKFQEDFPELF